MIDFDGPIAFDLHGVDLLVLDDEVLAFRNFVAARDVFPRHHVPRFGIHVLLLQTVAGLPVDPIETDLFAQGRRRIESNRAGHQGKPKIALPIRTRGHGVLLTNRFREVIPAILPNA